MPSADVRRLLEAGVTVGALTFAAVEWRGTRVSALPDAAVSWQAGDFVIALVCDVEGNVRASVLLDTPTGGMRPTSGQLLALSEDLRPALDGLLGTIEKEDLTRQLKVARHMRELVRELDHRTTLSGLVDIAREQMRDAFRADDVTLHLGADGDEPPVGDLVASVSLHDALDAALREAWDNRSLLVAESGGVRGVPSLGAAVDAELTALMQEYRIGTLVMVPIGYGGRYLGTLGVIRGEDAPRWTAGESEAALEVGRDLGRAVIDARRYERELRLREALDQLDEHRSHTVSAISHELKNPIGVIQGHLELLADGAASDDPEVARSLEAIARGAERLSVLANDLLLLSRVGDQAQPMSQMSVDMGRVVTEAVDFAQITADQAGVTVSVKDRDDRVVVDGDMDALGLVVSNLLGNAVKYSDRGDHVTLRVLRRSNWVIVVCSDTGLGISDEDRPHLFKEFFRSDNPAATARPGTGLGLVIVQRIVARHQGHLEVDSELGVGTTVTVSLPAAADPV